MVRAIRYLIIVSANHCTRFRRLQARSHFPVRSQADQQNENGRQSAEFPLYDTRTSLEDYGDVPRSESWSENVGIFLAVQRRFGLAVSPRFFYFHPYNL